MFYAIRALQNTDTDKYCAVNSLLLGPFCPKDQKHNTEPQGKLPKKSVFSALIRFSRPFADLFYLSMYVQSKKTISKWKLRVSRPPCCSFFTYGEILAKIQCSLSLFGLKCIISISGWRNRDKVSYVGWSHVASQCQLVKHTFPTSLLHSQYCTCSKLWHNAPYFFYMDLKLGCMNSEHKKALSHGEMNLSKVFHPSEIKANKKRLLLGHGHLSTMCNFADDITDIRVQSY